MKEAEAKTYGAHLPVLLDEIVIFFQENLENERALLFLDCTFGGGGHSTALLERFPQASLIAIDQDQEALNNGVKIIKDKKLDHRVEFLKGNFCEVDQLLQESSFFKSHGSLDGVLADFGVSSHQLDCSQRGFSFSHDGPLDMRMNQGQTLTAFDVVNNYSENELANIFYEYAQERLSRQIAAEIVRLRKDKKIERTKELENLIFHVYPKRWRYGRTHPATRAFQALRIEVNQELKVIVDLLDKIIPLMNSKSIVQLISFHSLEDRLVKQKFRELERAQIAKRLTKKPVVATEEEKKHNSRSRSAKLRVLQKN